MDQPQHVSQMLDNLRQQLEGQLAQLNQRRQQLRQNIQQEEVIDPATRAQVAQQQDVLQNLRYEADLLNEKLMKLRANRQLIEAELFQLKDKRIKLLEVINKLEDEEMQLVSEVNRLINYKRSLLREVPYFEERARASASLAVVQDYLAASVSHLREQAAGSSATAGGTAAAAGSLSAPSWRGTADVRRPSATWISMPPPTTAGSSPLTTPGSGTSSMPPTPAGQPPLAAEPSSTALGEAGPSLSAGLGIAGATAAVQQLSLEEQQQHGLQQQQGIQQQQLPAEAGRRVDYSPFGVVTPEGLLKMQQLDASPVEGLPTVPEGQPFPPGDTVEITTPLGSIEATLGLTRSMTAPSSGSFQSQGSAAAAGTSVVGARMPRDATSSTSGTSSDSATRFNRGILASSSSVRSDLRSGGSGALGSGSFTSPTAHTAPRRSEDDAAAMFGAAEPATAARGAEQQAGTAAETTQVSPPAPPPAPPPAQVAPPAPPLAASAASVAPPMQRRGSSILSPTPPPPPPRRARSMTLPGTLSYHEHQHQHILPPPPQQPPAPQPQQPSIYLQQHEIPRSPQRFRLGQQQQQPSSEQPAQHAATIPQLQYQIAQLAQAQAQLAHAHQAQQQQQQQQVLILDTGMAPVSVGLPGALNITGAAAAAGSGLDLSGFTTRAMGLHPPGISVPVHVSAGQAGGLTAAGTQLWVMPTGNVAVLQPDRPSPASGDSTQLHAQAGGLSLQQLHGLGAAGSSAAAAAAAGGVGAAGGVPHMSVGPGPVMLSPSPRGQPGMAPTGLFMQQTAEGMRLLHGQQFTPQQLGAQQSPTLQLTGQQLQQQLAAGQQLQQQAGEQLQQLGGSQLSRASPEQRPDPSV